MWALLLALKGLETNVVNTRTGTKGVNGGLLKKKKKLCSVENGTIANNGILAAVDFLKKLPISRGGSLQPSSPGAITRDLMSSLPDVHTTAAGLRGQPHESHVAPRRFRVGRDNGVYALRVERRAVFRRQYLKRARPIRRRGNVAVFGVTVSSRRH